MLQPIRQYIPLRYVEQDDCFALVQFATLSLSQFRLDLRSPVFGVLHYYISMAHLSNMNVMAEISPPVLRPMRPQRATGRLGLSFRHDRSTGFTRIERFYQEGCLKARLLHPAGACLCEAVLMNISGGIAGGDDLRASMVIGDQARVCFAGQAAERIYRALGDDAACITTTITVGKDARAEYLPQETILFDGFKLSRSLEIELAEDASFLGVESLVFGRRDMGETLHTGTLRDRVALNRDGKVLLIDMIRLEGDVHGLLARKAVANGAAAMATIIFAVPGVARWLEPVRKLLNDTSCEAGASIVEGVLSVRVLARSSYLVRAMVVELLMLFRNGRPLPRVWQS